MYRKIESLKFLNSKQKRDVMADLKEQYGFSGSFEGHLMRSNKDRLYLLSDSEFVQKGEYSKLRMDRAGLHVGTFTPMGIRLSIEGSQFVGPAANKMILDIDEGMLGQWVKGEDLTLSQDQLEALDSEKGLVIVRFGSDFIGSGYLKNSRLENNMPKVRQVKNFNR